MQPPASLHEVHETERKMSFFNFSDLSKPNTEAQLNRAQKEHDVTLRVIHRFGMTVGLRLAFSYLSGRSLPR